MNSPRSQAVSPLTLALWLALTLAALALKFASDLRQPQAPFNPRGWAYSSVQIKSLNPILDSRDYTIYEISKAHCDGRLYLQALQRNAEGAPLLKRAIGDEQGTQYFWFQGHSSSHFPSIAYWFSQQASALGLGSWLSKNDSQNATVITWLEQGNCSLFNLIKPRLP